MVSNRIIYVLSDHLTLRTNPPEGGTIGGVVGGQMLELNCGDTAAAKANTAHGWAFTNWSGGTDPGALTVLTNQPVLQFTMVSNLVLQANFADVQRPTLAITNPGPSGLRASNALVDVKGWARDNDRVTNVWVRVNQGPTRPAQTLNNWTNWALPNLGLTPGTNLLRAYAADASGNLSPTNTLAVVLDHTPSLLSATFVTLGQPAPRIGALAVKPGDSVELSLAGLPGRSYEIQVSSDLTKWETVATVPTVDGAIQFSEAEAWWQMRFYRARLVPQAR